MLDKIKQCYHCGLPVGTEAEELSVDIEGEHQPMCCPGCQAVAQAIVDADMTDYYRYRTQPSQTADELVPSFLNEIKAFDLPAVQQRFVQQGDGDVREASLILEGINCAACVWLNEQYLASLPGVISVNINYTNHRAYIQWHNDLIALSEIIEAVSRIGYLAHPYDPARKEAIEEKQRKRLLSRIGVAGVLGMQVMTLAVAMYAGAWWGMDPSLEQFFRWVSLILTLPVIGYSASLFFANAWRDLRTGRIGMDVPVSLGMGLAFVGSCWATIVNLGDVFFDSIVMFSFFLLLARYYELVSRKRASESHDELVRLQPAVANLVDDNGVTEQIVVASLRPGDLILVKPGDVVAADGEIYEGQSSVDESLLTGEFMPSSKLPGDSVIGGSINMHSPLYIKISKVGKDTVLSSILDMLDKAALHKPVVARMADKYASKFIVAVILLAVIVAVYGYINGNEMWLATTIAVLVVTCPCALSLATPIALSTATGQLARMGLLVVNGHSIETLAKADCFVFDKTGTLTRGRLDLKAIHPLGTEPELDCLSVACALEAGSEHPVARAIYRHVNDYEGDIPDHGIANHIVNTPGMGVSGSVEGQKWYLGSEEFILAKTGIKPSAGNDSDTSDSTQSYTQVWLATDSQLIASLVFGDNLRAGSKQLIQSLKRQDHEVMMLSGDNQAAVKQMASLLEVDNYQSSATPEIKLQQIRDLQSQGKIIAMVGDGINDAPVLAQAQVSIAMASGTQLASVSADMVLMSDRISVLADVLVLIKKSFQIIRQNLAWAVTYNVMAVPAAVMGYVPPWLAALGMSASSLVVVANSLRLSRR